MYRFHCIMLTTPPSIFPEHRISLLFSDNNQQAHSVGGGFDTQRCDCRARLTCTSCLDVTVDASSLPSSSMPASSSLSTRQLAASVPMLAPLAPTVLTFTRTGPMPAGAKASRQDGSEYVSSAENPVAISGQRLMRIWSTQSEVRLCKEK